MKTHGMTYTPEYGTWVAMKKRCYYHKTNDYERYGGAGITVCDQWRTSFEQFYKDVGPKPGPGYSLDRIDGTKGYFPENVRWATFSEQAKNRIIAPKRQKVEMICRHCSAAFTCGAYILRRGGGKYCSTTCAGASKRNRVELTCAYCKKMIIRHPSDIRPGGNYCCVSHQRFGTIKKAKLTPDPTTH